MNLNDSKGIPADLPATGKALRHSGYLRLRLCCLIWLYCLSVCCAAPLDEFRFVTASSKKVNLQQLATPRDGKRLPTLVVVWCSFCKSCRQTEPEMQRLAKLYTGKARIIAVNAHPADTQRTIADHRLAKKLSFEVVQDPGGAFCTAMNINFTTTSLLVDEQGKLVYFGAFFGFAEVNNTGATTALEQLLARQPIRTNQTPQRG